MRSFQAILLTAFLVIAVLGIIIFANYKGTSTQEERVFGDGIEIWGTLDADAVNAMIRKVAEEDDRFKAVSYKMKPAASFDKELLNALADGTPPDLVLLSQKKFVTWRSKLYSIPEVALQARTYKDTYIDGADLFLRTEGIYGFPVAIDPMIMYWNRDLFASAGKTLPPTTYESLLASYIAPLTVQDETYKVTQSAINMGSAKNIPGAPDIISLLMVQTEGKIVSEENGSYRVDMNNSTGSTVPPLTSALTFFTQFSNTQGKYYTWSGSSADDVTLFSAGTLAMYIGHASEYKSIRERNPNMNFDVAEVPQSGASQTRRTFGDIYMLAMPKIAKNLNGSFIAAQILATSPHVTVMTDALKMAPARRDLLTSTVADPVLSVAYKGAQVARGWFDPNETEVKTIIKEAVESITAGRSLPGSAASDARSRIEQLF